MSRIQRKQPRKPTNAKGYLYTIDGWPLGECDMKDISGSGAKLVHGLDEDLPTQFLLSLSRNGVVRRRCRVVWQNEKQVGVRFVAGE
jgi:hypothetical protein